MRVRLERHLPVVIAVWNGVFGGNAMQPDVRCIGIKEIAFFYFLDLQAAKIH